MYPVKILYFCENKSLLKMLLRFWVSNFMSFSEEVEFNMFPSALKGHKEHIYESRKIKLLKAAAIYGSNGSGKSNFIKAVHCLHDIVVSGDLEKCEVPCRPFKLNPALEEQPSTLGAEFQIGSKYYEYTISIKHDIIVEETLHETNPVKGNATHIFTRTSKHNKTILDVNPKFARTEKERIRFEIYAEDIAPNQSLIFKLKDKFTQATQVVSWFEKYVWILYPQSKYFLTARLCLDQDFKQFLNQLLPKLGTGMESVDIESIPFELFFGKDDENERKSFEEQLKHSRGIINFVKNGKEYVARKEKKNYLVHKVKTFNATDKGHLVEFEPEEQSDGTRRILDLIPAIQKMVSDQSIFFVDEIDRSLHPSMIKELVAYFMSHPSNGQLVFTSHESNLLDLDIFRQDEIWFTEKNTSGATNMYPLSEFHPRYDLNIRKGYLAGRFGAIPFLGNLKDLHWQYA